MKEQDYKSAQKYDHHTTDLGFLTLRFGEFIHIQANDQAVEVKMDDDGNILVCITPKVSVSSFNEVYGE